MKIRNKIILTTIVSALFLSLVGCVKHSAEDKAEWMVKKVANELKLNDSQIEKLNDVKGAVMVARKNIKADKDSQFETVTTMLKSDALNKAEIKLLIKNKMEQFDVNSDPVIEKLVVFHASLSADQKQEIVDFMNEHKNEGGHFGRHSHW